MHVFSKRHAPLLAVAHQAWLPLTAGAQVRGKVLGVVGYGHVGSQLSILAEALGMQVIFYDIVPKVRVPHGGERVTWRSWRWEWPSRCRPWARCCRRPTLCRCTCLPTRARAA